MPSNNSKVRNIINSAQESANLGMIGDFQGAGKYIKNAEKQTASFEAKNNQKFTQTMAKFEKQAASLDGALNAFLGKNDPGVSDEAEALLNKERAAHDRKKATNKAGVSTAQHSSKQKRDDSAKLNSDRSTQSFDPSKSTSDRSYNYDSGSTGKKSVKSGTVGSPMPSSNNTPAPVQTPAIPNELNFTLPSAKNKNEHQRNRERLRRSYERQRQKQQKVQDFVRQLSQNVEDTKQQLETQKETKETLEKMPLSQNQASSDDQTYSVSSPEKTTGFLESFLAFLKSLIASLFGDEKKNANTFIGVAPPKSEEREVNLPLYDEVTQNVLPPSYEQATKEPPPPYDLNDKTTTYTNITSTLNPQLKFPKLTDEEVEEEIKGLQGEIEKEQSNNMMGTPEPTPSYLRSSDENIEDKTNQSP